MSLLRFYFKRMSTVFFSLLCLGMTIQKNINIGRTPDVGGIVFVFLLRLQLTDQNIYLTLWKIPKIKFRFQYNKIVSFRWQEFSCNKKHFLYKNINLGRIQVSLLFHSAKTTPVSLYDKETLAHVLIKLLCIFWRVDKNVTEVV